MPEGDFPATVIGVLGQDCVMINRGARHGVKKGQQFLVYGYAYSVSEGPETAAVRRTLRESKLQKGSGIVVHVEDDAAALRSVGRPFHQPAIGDKVRPI